MRRPAVLAFSLFAIAASLPAEIRECLPMPAACGHRAASAGAGCSRSAEMTRKSSCGTQRRAGCPKAQPTRESGRCRLHPTPPIVHPATTPPLEPPVASVGLEPLPAPEVLLANRSGWREPPALRPRASPASAPRSPRPPPFSA